jgi:hypothetical protein
LVKPRPVLIDTWKRRRKRSLKMKQRIPNLKIKHADATTGWVSHDIMQTKAKASVVREKPAMSSATPKGRDMGAPSSPKRRAYLRKEAKSK